MEEEVEKFSQCDKSVNERWEILKGVIKESAEKNVGYRRGTKAKKPWVTAEMISKMEERRKFKNDRSDKGKQMYRKLNYELRRETYRAREEWWTSECEELEELDRSGRSDLMYEKLKRLTGQNNNQKKCMGIMNEDGDLVTEPKRIKNRWTQYVEILYDKAEKPSMTEMKLEKEGEIEIDNVGTELLKSEVMEANYT